MRTSLSLVAAAAASSSLLLGAGSARAQEAAAPAATPAPAAAPPAAAAAQPAEKPEEQDTTGGNHREVNGHRFITPVFEGYSAFTNSSILFEQGFGAYIANFRVPTGIPGIGNVQPALFQYHQLFAAQIAIANRVSIDLRAKGTADIGSNTKNLLAFGVIGDVEAGATPKLRLFTLDKVGLTMSVGANISYEHQVELSPLSVLEAVANGKSASRGVQQTDGYVISPMLLIAEGVGPFGVQVAGFPRLENGSFSQNDFVLDVHVALDIQRITHAVPIALTFEYEPDFFLSDTANDKAATSNGMAAGLYYSGRRDFSLGGVFTYESVKTSGQDANEYAGLMTMQYFF